MKLIIGNKNYSSWSLRGWLAAKQSGLSFEELTVHIDGDDWQAARREQDQFQPSAGKVPVSGDDQAHSLTFQGERRSAQLVVQSVPEKPSTFLANAAAANDQIDCGTMVLHI